MDFEEERADGEEGEGGQEYVKVYGETARTNVLISLSYTCKQRPDSAWRLGLLLGPFSIRRVDCLSMIEFPIFLTGIATKVQHTGTIIVLRALSNRVFLSSYTIQSSTKPSPCYPVLLL